MNPENHLLYAGVILDLDGVVTNTALLHIKAWKKSLDSFLLHQSEITCTKFFPMNTDTDYKIFIDGKPRYDGIRSFINSRNINLPFGSPTDKPGFVTICALGNLKNQIYLESIDSEGVQVYTDAIEMINRWRSVNLKTAIVSASKNCRKVLSSVGIINHFDVIIDGNDSEIHNIPGKPQPDIFLWASRLLGVSPAQAIIIEDSVAGVKAGKNGHFSRVIGVSRNHSESDLYQNGADLVVSKLTDLPIYDYEN